ncbi:MAG: VOC family protein, partial [Candidatus Dojkabacteria bacterium]
MQVKEMAAFYEKVFGRKADMEMEGWYGWDLGGATISIGEHSETAGKSPNPARIIINLETKDVKSEFERIKAAGATVIKEPYEMGGGWLCTFADLDGNYFQLTTPWEN